MTDIEREAEFTVGLCRQCLQASKVAPDSSPSCPRCGSSLPLIPLAGAGGLSEDQLVLLINDQSARAEDRVRHQARWVSDFYHRLLSLRDEGTSVSDDFVGFFWIRLHGILGELPALLDSPGAEILAGASAEQKAHLRPYQRMLFGKKMALELVQEISAALTRDEHIFIDWCRQRLSHLEQTTYTVQLTGPSGKKDLKQGSRIKSLDDHVTVDERDAAILCVLAVNHHDEFEAARTIARKIGRPAEALYRAFRELILPELWEKSDQASSE